MKAQVAVETLAVYSAVLLVFLFALSLMSGQIPNIAHAKDSMDSFRVARDLGSAINSIFLAGDGAAIDVYIGAENASAAIAQRYLNVRVGGAYYDWPLLTNRTNSTDVPLGEIRIKNAYGMISVEEL